MSDYSEKRRDFSRFSNIFTEMTSVCESWSKNERWAVANDHKNHVTRRDISPTNERDAQNLPVQSEGAMKKDAEACPKRRPGKAKIARAN